MDATVVWFPLSRLGESRGLFLGSLACFFHDVPVTIL